MFLSKKINKFTAVGVFSALSGPAIAVVEGARNDYPRVLLCDLLPSAGLFNEYVRTHDLRHAACVDVLAMNVCSLLQVDLQGVKEEEKRDAARWQVHELLDYSTEEAVLDVIEVPVLGEKNNSKTFAVAAPAATLRKRVELLVSTGMHLDAIDIPELALRNLLELFPNEPRGICLLWIREQTGLLVVCRGGTFYFSRSINIGLEQLRQTIPSSVENPPPENLQSELAGIVLEVQRSLDYCESNFRLPPVPKILLAACGEEPQGVREYLDRYLQADVVSADFRQVLDFPAEIEPSTVNFCLPALGAALRAGGRK